MPTEPTPSELWRRWIADRGSQTIIVLVPVLAAYVAWHVFGWGGPDHQQTIGDLAFWPVNLVATILAFRVARTKSFRTRVRRAWLLIGLGLVSYLLGDVLQLVYEAVLDEKPYPTVADAAYLAFYPLLFAGILQLPRDRFKGFALVRLCLDGAATVVAGAAIVWYVTLASATESAGSRLQLAVSIAYPCGDLLLILALTALAVRTRGILGSWSLNLMKVSVLLYIAADIVYGQMSVAGTYSGGEWVDIGWMFAIALLAASANEQYRVGVRGLSPGEGRRTDGGFVFLPYVAAAVTFGFATISSGQEGRLEGGSLALLGAAILIVLARLHWSTVDGRRMHEDAERARSEFFATVSHELRTPLTSIRGYCELLGESDEVTGEAREFVQVVQRNAMREERIVADLLFLNSIDLLGSLETVDADLVAIVDEAVESRVPAATEAGVRILWTRPDDLFEVQVDPDRMGQVVDNLLTNAIKFSGAGSAVRVTISGCSGTASVRVRDSGPGIPDDEAGQVFDRLYRGELARNNAVPGAGLGLAIAREIVDAFHGSIRLEQQPGAGACFRIDLPAVRSERTVARTNAGSAAWSRPAAGPAPG